MKSGRILVIDDDASIRDVMKMSLETEGYEVVSAENGKAGLESIKLAGRPSVIVLDLMMPVMNGWKFLDAMKTDPVLTSIPVIVISAFVDQEPNIAASEVLSKPFSMRILLDKIRKYC